MAKKFQLDEQSRSISTFDPAAATEKLPVDISGGKKPINEYQEIPINLIIPYQNKKDSDFRPYSEEKLNLLAESIKKDGILEAVSLRALPDGRFETLAGEHRIKAATIAGLTHVPAHVLSKITDEQAEILFSATNLLRRENTIMDRIAGWWHYYEANGHKLSVETDEGDSLDLAIEVTKESSQYSKRHIYRYIKMHELIPELQERLDAERPKNISLMTGYWLSSLPAAQQQLVQNLNVPIPENKAKVLKEEYEKNYELSEDFIRMTFARKKPSAFSFQKLNTKIKKLVTEEIDPAYQDQSEKIFADALQEYLNNHPEFKKQN